MKLLDLFCGAGGCAMGYHRSGFSEIVGVDIKPQPHYPFHFIRDDALEFLAATAHKFDAIHASPPCQCYSSTRHLPNVRTTHQDLLAPTREALTATGKPWVIENVPGAPIDRSSAICLCGLMFGLKVFRHRWFESSIMLMGQRHPRHGDRRIGVGGFACVAGNGSGYSGWRGKRRVVPYSHRSAAAWSKAMGIGWMNRNEMAQAIPPTYTEYVGRQLLSAAEALA